jgi:hypothetical protein
LHQYTALSGVLGSGLRGLVPVSRKVVIWHGEREQNKQSKRNAQLWLKKSTEVKGKKDKEIKEVERACVSMLGEAGRNGFLSVGTSTPQGHEPGPKPLRACQLVVISFFFPFLLFSVLLCSFILNSLKGTEEKVGY